MGPTLITGAYKELPTATTRKSLHRTDCCSLRMMLSKNVLQIIDGSIPFDRLPQICGKCRTWETLTYQNGQRLDHLVTQ